MARIRRERLDDSPDEILVAAYAALEDGRVTQGRDLAEFVLAGARGVDLLVEARALACLAHCDRVGSRPRRASEEARRAAQLFEQLGDTVGEAKALTTLAHASVVLGRHAEAVDAALLAARLCDAEDPQPHAVLAYNSLGLAYSWSGDHERGLAALERAVEIARHCDPQVSPYQPRMNQIFIEAACRVDERYQTGSLGRLDEMARLVQECQALERAGLDAPVLPGLRAMGVTISSATYALFEAWRGDPVAAERLVATAVASLQPTRSWLDAVVRWPVAELAWARQDWPAAEQALGEMCELALAVEHEQLACRAQLLLVQVLELQGRYAEAQREQRALRLREQRAVVEGLSSRDAHVRWQLGARQSERRLQKALVASRQFERWSLEDALTGIANRRHFEQRIGEMLTVGDGLSVTLGMIDVDRFKRVNDEHGHRVGDRALKTLAAVMASQLRDRDMLARWGGDEFVVLFDGAPESVARQICERLRIAVQTFDWESIAPGLQLSVSIGLSEARAGEDIESVLHRSDSAMYGEKID
jgi:diguanylate cyclase (GGDEF)-like protein